MTPTNVINYSLIKYRDLLHGKFANILNKKIIIKYKSFFKPENVKPIIIQSKS